mmetsp:Transcript_10541/g.31763  ORF Transcript_10541/g.31763 Transcript_10541/m.31763 type:complete len:753 (+) Transcript_10541:160-2418(+)
MGNFAGKEENYLADLDGDLDAQHMGAPMAPMPGGMMPPHGLGPHGSAPMMPPVPASAAGAAGDLGMGAGEGMDLEGKEDDGDTDTVPTVFRWEHGGRQVYITGTFNNWERQIPMHRSGNDFTYIHDLRRGKHAYKFVVDDEWRFAPDQPTVADIEGRINNFIDVHDFKSLEEQEEEEEAPSCGALLLCGPVPPVPAPPKTYPKTAAELRVVIVTPSLFVPDGVSLTLCKLARHLRAAGGEVALLTTKPRGPAPDLPTDLNVIFAPGLAVPISGQQASYQLGAMIGAEAEDAVRHFRPNVVHLSVPDWNGLGMAKLAGDLGAALVCTYHSNYGDYLRFYGVGFARRAFNAYLAHFYSHVPVLYCPTPFIRSKLLRDGIGEATTLKIWGRGVDFGLFHPALRSQRFRERYGFGADDVVVLWVGRLVKEKRPDVFLRVVERLNREGFACKGLVVGTGVYEQPLSLSPHIVTAGFLSGTSLATAYASSDLLLFPSTVETFGNVTLEALAAGCPVVVDANCSGHLVQGGVNGEAVESGDADAAEAYYDATRRLVSNHAYRSGCASASRASVAHCSAEAVQGQMLQNYLEMAKAKGESAPESMAACHATADSRIVSERFYSLWRIAFFFVYPVMSLITGVANALSLCECSPCKAVKRNPKAGSRGTTELRIILEDASDDDEDDKDDIEAGVGARRRARSASKSKVRTLSADLVLAPLARSASFGVVSIFHLQDRRRVVLVLALYGSLLLTMTWLMFNL